MRFLRWTFLLSVFSVGCAANTLGGPTGPSRMDECVDDRDCLEGYACEWDGERNSCLPPGTGEPPRPPEPPVEPPVEPMDCTGPEDCPSLDYTCEARGERRICIPPPVGPGDECDPACGADEECRDGVCIGLDPGGAFCEFDPECAEGELCIAGRCTWDPRVPRGCDEGGTCPGSLMCVEGECVCERDADCPVGTVCEDGSCVPEDGGCVADEECPAGMLCDRGMCVPDGACDVVHPDLSGDDWEMDTTLEMRESLPGWLDGLLSAVEGPFLFLAGHTDDPDLGLPGFIESAVGDAIRSWAEDNVPRWVLDLLGAIGIISDVIETWEIHETMRLGPGPDRDSYVGNRTWEEVCFEYLGDDVCDTPEAILGWRIEVEGFQAQAVCGTFNIERHDIEVSIGRIIAWMINAVIEETTGYPTLSEALADARVGFCDEVGYVAYDIAEALFAGYGGAAEAGARLWCNDTLDDLARDLTDAIDMARLDADVMSLKGYAPIVDRANLMPGTWEGSLLGGDFPGTFTAYR